MLITSYLDYSLPYRMLFARATSEKRDVRGPSDRLLDSLVMLLVRLHLAGFSWGDCSLNNTLFRRDSRRAAVYVVDAETGEWHGELSVGPPTSTGSCRPSLWNAGCSTTGSWPRAG